MMTTQTSTASLYPPGGFGAPKDRRGHASGADVGLPAGTVIFSADNHISLADDIFYQRFPDDLKDKHRGSGTRTAPTKSGAGGSRSCRVTSVRC